MSDTQEDLDTGAPEAAADEGDPATVVADVKRQLATAEQNYAQALAREREKSGRLTEATTRLETVEQDRAALQVQTVANALEATKAETASLKRDLRAAMEAGDYDKVAEYNVELGRLGARMETLQTGKAELEARRTQELRRPEPPAGDPIEADLAKRTPASAGWLRKQTDANGKPRFYTDSSFQAKVIGADSLAIGNGLTRDTPQYFDFIERTIGVKQDTGGDADPPARQERAVPAAAPTRPAATYRDNQTRSAGGHIPATAVQAAKMMGVDPVVYWQEAQRMERAGEFKLGNPHRRSA